MIAGPTGTGKTTLCQRLVASHPEIERIVTCTTRPPRAREQHGVDYFFLSDAEFDEALANDEFLEWAQVHTSRYGTKKSAVFNRLAHDVDLVVNVDVQGARAYRQAFESHPTMRGRLVTVFIMPPDMETIYDRLLTREQDTKEQIERRMKTALYEIEQWAAVRLLHRDRHQRTRITPGSRASGGRRNAASPGSVRQPRSNAVEIPSAGLTRRSADHRGGFTADQSRPGTTSPSARVQDRSN